MADDEPIARRTRSQTSATRTANAEREAQLRATHANNERLQRQAARLARIESTFPRIGPHDVIANHAAATRAAIDAAQITRISDRLAQEIQRIRNAATNSIQPSQNRRQLQQGNSRNRISARRAIIDARRIMDVNVSSLYDVTQDIYAYLNVDQMLYFARNSITDNYYYRKLELAYGIPTIDKFNTLCQNIIDNIPSTVDIATAPYRYDIDYYCQIINFLEEINEQYLLVNDKKEIKRILISELTNSINNEKITINNLITHLETVLANIDNSQAVVRAINETITKLHTRRDNLESITSRTIKQHFNDPEFEKIRTYTLIILQAAKTLCKIFLILIIKLYNIQDLDIDVKAAEYEDIILNMYDVIANFTQIMSTLSSNNDELRLLYTIQSTLYTSIKNSLSRFAGRRTLINMMNEYNIQHSTQFIIEYDITRPANTVQLHALTYELDLDPINFDRILTGRARSLVLSADISRVLTNYRAENRRIAIDLRRQALIQRQQERLAARILREQAQEAQRAARAAAREAARAARAPRVPRAPRAVRGNISSGPVASSVSLSNIDEMFEIDANADMQFTTTYITDADDRYKNTADSFLQKLKEKYIHHSKDFKSTAQRQLIFNEIKSRFSTKFNSDEPTPRIRDSIENFVGNSIASLFARYLYYGNDIKFNDLGKYYVVNYTLQKESDNPDTPLTDKYRKIRQAGIDAGGLRRDFITALTEELFEKKIFITREGTKKYFLNPFYQPDEEFKYIVKIATGMDILDNDRFIRNFYLFIGQLLSFILVNDCGIQHNLSSYIMANFNNRFTTDIEDHDYVYYMLIDFPEFTKSLLNLMADPANIEWACIGFNDYYKLTSEDADVKDDTIEEYLILVSKFMMTTTILRKGIDIPPGTDENDLNAKARLMHDCLVTGINLDIKLYLKPFTLKSINSYLVTPTMSDEIVNKLVRNFTNTMNRKNRNLSGPGKLKSEKLTQLFISHVLTNKNPDDKEGFFKFIDKLLKFWSGSAFYKETEEYKIQINGVLTPGHLPQSHTCFFLIDLPDYITNDSDDQIGQLLYDKINTAISNVEGGMGFAGGKKPAKKSAKKSAKK